MFINKLNIKEFRGIKSCKKTIELSNFTVLIGRNNSGKSTILEALSLLPHPEMNNQISGNTKFNYLVSLHQSFKRLLYLYAGTSTLEYYIRSNNIRFELQEHSYKTIREDGSNYRTAHIGTFFNLKEDEVISSVIFIPDTTAILDNLENKIRQYRELITKKGLHKKLAKILNEFVNDKYSELVFLEPISLRKVYQDNTVYIQLKDLGSGAEKVIKIMAVLEIMSPKLVLIDDFEAGLHPSLIKLFLEWLKRNEWQTIISTHSIDVLYHLVDISPEDTTILQLSKSSEDILSHEVLTLEQLEDILDANNDPRMLGDLIG